jgi:hypothetical protein
MTGRPCASSSQLTDRQGQMGPAPHPLAKCICGSESQGPAPRRSAASIGAATQLSLVRLRRSAAIIGAATPLLLVRLRRSAAIIGALCATILILSSCARSRSSSSVFPMIIAASIIGAATTADQQGGIQILKMCGYAASIIGAATTADQQGGIQILKMCGLRAAQRSYYWCGSGAYYWRCYAALIGAATQLLLALLRSSYWRCVALIGAATQLLLALLRSYFGAATTGGSAGGGSARGGRGAA